MKNFKFDYDSENDDLFIYLEGEKSAGAVELGNFVFDFNKDENLVAIQIFEASNVLSKLLSKIIEMAKIKQVKADIIKFRNMAALKLFILTDKDEAQAVITLPRISQESPSLCY